MVRKSVFTRIYVYILIIFVVLMICFGALIYHNATRTVRQQLGSKCIGIATAAAVIIEMDIEGFQTFCEDMDTEGSYYKETYEKLNRIRRENDGSIAFLYTEIRISATEMMYIIDAEDVDSELFSPPGCVEELTDSELAAYGLGTPYIADEFITDDYDTVLSCYAPITNASTGELVGLVGVDVSIDQHNAIMQNQLVIVFASIAILILMLGFSLLISSGRVERLTMRDSLTGIYNRSHFMRTLRQQLKYSDRHENTVTVLMADIDFFKIVNDTYGHPFGDFVLNAVAETIGSVLRKTDCLARYGGDEFVAFLPNGGANATQVVERIRQAVENMHILNMEINESLHVTISIGVTHVKPGQTAVDAIDMADKALYFAKKNRNTICVYEN